MTGTFFQNSKNQLLMQECKEKKPKMISEQMTRFYYRISLLIKQKHSFTPCQGLYLRPSSTLPLSVSVCLKNRQKLLFRVQDDFPWCVCLGVEG